jgi:hypothetical protein
MNTPLLQNIPTIHFKIQLGKNNYVFTAIFGYFGEVVLVVIVGIYF